MGKVRISHIVILIMLIGLVVVVLSAFVNINKLKGLNQELLTQIELNETEVPSDEPIQEENMSNLDILVKRDLEIYSLSYSNFEVINENTIIADKYSAGFNKPLIEENMILFESVENITEIYPNQVSSMVLYKTGTYDLNNEAWYVFDAVDSSNIKIDGKGKHSIGDPGTDGMKFDFEWASDANLISAYGSYQPSCGKMKFIYDAVADEIVEILRIVQDAPCSDS